ncbi:MAG: thiol reductant ABC exporter subunit CydD [Terracoccus sp.]
MRPFDPRLLRLLPAARRPVAALGVVGVVSGAATIGTAFALTALVVAVVEGGPLGPPAAWLAALFAVRALLAGITERVAAWAGVAVSTALRSALLRRWSTLNADSRPEPAAAVSLATTGATTVEPYAARFLPTLVTASVVPVLAIATLVVVDWPSAVVVVLTVPLLPLFAALIGRATADETSRRWAALASLGGHFLDVVQGLPTLVTYGRAGRQVEAVREVSERHRRATMRTLRLAFLSSAALELLATISVAIVAVTVGLRLSTGSLDLGPALVAILLAPEAFWPIRRVGAEFHAAADGAAALDDILTHLTSTAPSTSSAPSAPSPLELNASFGFESSVTTARSRTNDAFGSTTGGAAVRLSGVSYRYGADLPDVVDHLDLVAGPGLTVVTGPSGVGKSTVLDLVAGVRRPTAGEVAAPVSHYVTQRPFLAAGSIREALTIGYDADDAALWQALREVEVEGVVAALPGGLSSGLGDDGFGLSAGQRQRLALARAWLAPEPVLLLDEPTAHLDPDSASAMAELIAGLAERRVVVAVTHRDELLAYAQQHVHLSRPQTAHSATLDPGEVVRT